MAISVRDFKSILVAIIDWVLGLTPLARGRCLLLEIISRINSRREIRDPAFGSSR